MNPNTLATLGESGAEEALKLRVSLIAALRDARITSGDQFSEEWTVGRLSNGAYTLVNASQQSLPVSSPRRKVIEAIYEDACANFGR